eukprot:6214080-Pleurochrysis_carterae.AAC.5
MANAGHAPLSHFERAPLACIRRLNGLLDRVIHDVNSDSFYLRLEKTPDACYRLRLIFLAAVTSQQVLNSKCNSEQALERRAKNRAARAVLAPGAGSWQWQRRRAPRRMAVAAGDRRRAPSSAMNSVLK